MASEEDLARAVKIAAKVVSLYGEVYLPVFNRIHAELNKVREQKQNVSLALELAKSYVDEEQVG